MDQPSSYTVVETLATTRGAVVYRAVSHPDHTPVVLKVVDARRHQPRDRERLEHEYEIGTSLDARFAVRPVALATYQGLPALVLPDLGLQPLDRLLGAPLEVARFLELAMRIAECVDDLHRRGIVHKNLKPENLLVAPATGDVKLADFGLASRLPREPQAAQPPRLIEGSLPYMAPEQTGRMNRGVDSRADLYALGVTFYQMLAGRLPFQASDPVEWVHCHVARPVPPLAETAPHVPAALARVVTKLLAKMPEDRYETARGLRHDLERCRAEWTARGAIDTFPLGTRDVPDRLQIPQTLYGREADIAALLHGFERVVAQGTAALLLVRGYAGVGKSALVGELHKPVVRARGFFAAGKFDQYKRDVPYATFVQALQHLVREILAAGDAQRAAWQRRLLAALGVNAQLIVDVIPHVALVIGPQPPVPALPPAEAQNRFRLVFRQFVSVFAQPDHPLALFLDDLQWADAASLELLEDLVTAPEMRALLVVGAYRDHEVGPAHSLARMLDAAREQGARISDIVLGPLSREHLTAFVADALHCPRDAALPLADLVYAKTAGNPFFAIQFLTALYDERLVDFDGRAGAWRWDLAKIRAKGFTDNVVDLMLGKLQRLPAETLAAVTQFAALGNTAEVGILALVYGRSEAQTNADLWEAVRSGLVLHPAGETSYRFLHDRVHEAAYALIPEAARAQVHLRIGRLLMSQLPHDALQERVFDVVHQLNRGVGLLTDPQEKAQLCALNVAAGTKAKAAIAYAAARSYLAQAAALLPDDAWDTRYQDALSLQMELAECEYLVGDFQRADDRLALALAAARTLVDRAKVHLLRSRLYQLAGHYGEAVTAAWEALRLLGVSIPASEPDLHAATEAELREVTANLAGRRIADLVDAPEVTDAHVAMLLRCLEESITPAYFARPASLPFLVAKAVNLSLLHGHQAASCVAYSTYAGMLISHFGDITTAFELSEMAMRLNEKLGDRKSRGRLLMVHGLLINSWRHHFATDFPYLDQALQACLEVGDLLGAGYLAFFIVWQAFQKGDPLDEVLQVSRRYEALAQQHHNDVVCIAIRLLQQLVASLTGRTRAPARFDDDSFDEAAALAEFERAAFGSGVTCYHVAKQVAAFTYGLYADALAAAQRAAEALGQLMAGTLEAAHYFYSALTLTALYPQASAEERREFAQRLDGLQAKHKFWAEYGPANYQHRYALVSAEIARIHGRDLDAARLYEDAIRAARENGFVQYEALAYELAAAFYRARQFDQIADTYLVEARACYVRWGADGKVAQLDRHHPQLLERRPLAASATFAARAEQLDLLAVVKASQAISSTLVLDQLARTLLRVAVEQSGAQRGVLLLVEGDTLAVVAMATLRDGAVATEVVPATPVTTSALVPAGLVQYVRLTQERVILDDAAKDAGRFAADPYLCRKTPRAVLGVPILRQATVIGVLYLENDLVAGAFTPDRLAALELLAAQSAISTENARLLAKEQAARAAAEAAEGRAAFLARVSATLSESLDVDATFARLGRQCVGTLADWCLIDVLVEAIEVGDAAAAHTGVIRRLAGVHVDPAKQPVLDALERRYPPRWDSPQPTIRVLRTGAPLLLPEVADHALRAFCVDDAHAELVRALGVRSGLVVPLVARGLTFGVLSLASAAPERRYGPADLELAQEVARRAAAAIDNARLYRTAQEAIRARDEFFLMAAHELRTPVTSLQFVIQGLVRGTREGRPAASPQKLALAERQTQRLTTLINQLLDVARIETGQLELLLEDYDLATDARQILERLRPHIEQAGAPVTLHAPAPLVGRWDRSRVDQLLTNLLSNALTYGAGRPIDLELARTDGGVRIVVRDRGLGIAADRLPHIFERFVRASSTRHYGGLGLGLFIVQQIVDVHRGTVAVESELGRGSTFTVDLPLAPPAPPSPVQ